MESIQRLRQSAHNWATCNPRRSSRWLMTAAKLKLFRLTRGDLCAGLSTGPGLLSNLFWPAVYHLRHRLAIGGWLNCDFDWGHHDIIVWGHDHPRPANWWHEPPRQRDMGQATVWRPRNYPGAVADSWWRPGLMRSQSAEPVVATVGRSVSDSAAPRRTPAPAARPEAPATRTSMPVARPTPAPVEYSQPVSRPESNRRVHRHPEFARHQNL